MSLLLPFVASFPIDVIQSCGSVCHPSPKCPKTRTMCRTARGDGQRRTTCGDCQRRTTNGQKQPPPAPPPQRERNAHLVLRGASGPVSLAPEPRRGATLNPTARGAAVRGNFLLNHIMMLLYRPGDNNAPGPSMSVYLPS